MRTALARASLVEDVSQLGRECVRRRSTSDPRARRPCGSRAIRRSRRSEHHVFRVAVPHQRVRADSPGGMAPEGIGWGERRSGRGDIHRFEASRDEERDPLHRGGRWC